MQFACPDETHGLIAYTEYGGTLQPVVMPEQLPV